MYRLLLIGEDIQLLETRAAVLAREAEVEQKTSAGFYSARPSGPFDLVVFCHTIDEASRVRLMEVIRQTWRGTKILQVEPNLGSLRSIGEDADTVATPRMLLRKVRELLDASKLEALQ